MATSSFIRGAFAHAEGAAWIAAGMAAKGKATVTVDPLRGRLAIAIDPPARSAIALQMASPRPAPPVVRVLDGSPR